MTTTDPTPAPWGRKGGGQTPEPRPTGPTPLQRRAMRNAIIAMSAGSLSFLALQYGLVLLYLTAQHRSSAAIVFLLALPLLLDAALRVPAAHLADRVGKKRVGLIGATVNCLGFAVLTLSGFAPVASAHAHLMIDLGILIYSVGNALFGAGWFALLSPIIPESDRGRFFGRNRVTWQTVGIVLALLCATFLSAESPIGAFQVTLAVITLGHLLMIVFYLPIPELERATGEQPTLGAALGQVLRADGFMSFCSYVFLLALFTAGCPILFSLIEKRVLELGDDAVVWLGILGMVGAVCGYYLGGKAVDRLGTKLVFMVCHFGYGLVLLAFLFRQVGPAWVLPIVAGVNFLFGLVWAASSIAITTEMLALIPPNHKSLSTSVCMVLIRGGGALSGVLASWALKMGLLSPQWSFLGTTLSQYDTILLVCSVMVILMVVTLGLVPSVIRKAEWFPRP